MNRYRQRKTGFQSRLKALPCSLLLLLLTILPVYAGGVVIQAAGDVMLGGRWEQQMAQDGYYHPFARISSELKKGDITLVNLEAPLTGRGKEFTDKKYRFRVKPSAITALKKAGITTVTLANNHSMDYGAVGLYDTLQQLDKAGIGHVGAGENLAASRRSQVYDIRGTKVALLGYSLTLPLEFWASEKRAGTAPLMEKMVKEDIAAARKQASIVIVTVHWGEEGKTQLREYQPRLARMMIDAGADTVIGHHPHILQGVETYKRGIIFYSLGNFAFAHKSRIADRTLLVRLRFDGDKRSAVLLPVNILHKEVGFQATPLAGKRADELIARVKKLPPANLAVRKEGEHWLVDF
ncbi:MAG: CapA family protein [Trichlorobacter sp.]|uniref:CapA family protein n=1 Tax=Trichlorobacter sp. TaxID=2911007 RepID=UPI00256C636F|nr:CapA family protein [Trichlorobacter sp.]MDK9718593.1 CapA family protein [Trichlorobacter sp.]